MPRTAGHGRRRTGNNAHRKYGQSQYSGKPCSTNHCKRSNGLNILMFPLCNR